MNKVSKFQTHFFRFATDESNALLCQFSVGTFTSKSPGIQSDPCEVSEFHTSESFPLTRMLPTPRCHASLFSPGGFREKVRTRNTLLENTAAPGRRTGGSGDGGTSCIPTDWEYGPYCRLPRGSIPRGRLQRTRFSMGIQPLNKQRYEKVYSYTLV